MANSFVLTARLVLLPPTNVKNVVQFLNSQLGQIETKVKLSVPQSTLTGLRKIEDRLRASENRIAGMIQNMQRFNAESTKTANNIDRVNRVGGSSRARNIGISYDVGNTNRQIAAISRVSSAMGNLQKNTIKSRDEFERFGQQAAISLRRFGAFTLAAGTFIKLSNAFSAGIREAIAFDLQMTKLSQVVGSSRQSISGLESEITKLSVNLGVSSSKIADVALTLAQAGLSAEKTRVAMEVLAKTELAPTFENIKDTGEAAIAVLAQFGGGVQSLSKDFSEINRIAAKFAVESSDLTTAISKAGGVFQAAGGSLRELLALFTSVRQTTRESADSIATGFRTIFARLQRPKTQNFLEALGIDLKDSEGLFVGPYKAIQRLSEALKDLETTDPRFAKIIEEVGGYRQISRVIPLIKQFEVAERARLEAIRSGDSLTKDAIRAQESFAIKISKVREEFLATIRAFSNDSNVKGFTDSLLRLASAFNTVLDAARPILPILGALGAISGLPRASRIYTAFRREEKRTPFATGGVVPGVGNSDSVKADLTPGEYVIKKSSARKIGYDTLHAMNNHAQKFANGGRVRFANGGRQGPYLDYTKGRKLIDGDYPESTPEGVLGILGRHGGFPEKYYGYEHKISRKTLEFLAKQYQKGKVGYGPPLPITNETVLKHVLEAQNQAYAVKQLKNVFPPHQIDNALKQIYTPPRGTYIGNVSDYYTKTHINDLFTNIYRKSGLSHIKTGKYYDPNSVAESLSGSKNNIKYFKVRDNIYKYYGSKFASKVEEELGVEKIYQNLKKEKNNYAGTNFFRAIGNSSVEKQPIDIQRALEEYGESSSELNSYLVGDTSYHKPFSKEYKSILAKNATKIRKATLSDRLVEDSVLYSGLRDGGKEILSQIGDFKGKGNKLVGKSFYMKRFLSSSIRKNVAREFVNEDSPVMLRILTSKNQNLFKLGGSENEAIFPNNQSFRIAGHIYQDEGITVVPVRPYAKGGRVGFADGGIADVDELLDRLQNPGAYQKSIDLGNGLQKIKRPVNDNLGLFIRRLSPAAARIAGSKRGYLPALSSGHRQSIADIITGSQDAGIVRREAERIFPIHEIKSLSNSNSIIGSLETPDAFSNLLNIYNDAFKNKAPNIRDKRNYLFNGENNVLAENLGRVFSEKDTLHFKSKRFKQNFYKIRNALRKNFGEEQTENLANYLKIYTKQRYPSTESDKLYFDKTKKFKGRFFPEEVHEAIYQYQQSSSGINSYLSGLPQVYTGRPILNNKEYAGLASRIRAATVSSTLGHDEVLYAGLRNHEELINQFGSELFDDNGNVKNVGNKLVGKSFNFKRFISATNQKRYAEMFTDKIKLKILAGKDTKLYKTGNTLNEVVFPNNQSFRVAGHIYPDGASTIIPIRPYAKGGRVGFADGGRTQLINGPEVFKDKLKLANKDFRKFFGFNIEELVGGRVSYTKEARDGKGNSPDGFFAGRYRSKNDAGLPEIFGNDFIGKEGLIHEGLHAIDRQARVTGKYSAASRGSRNPIAKLAASLKNEEGLRLLYLLSGVRKDDKGAAYLQTPEEIFAHIGAAYISGPRKLQQLLSENNFAPSVYKNISSTFKEVQGYVALPTIKDRIFRSKYGNVTDLAKIDPNARAISDFKALELIGPYNGPSTLLGRQKESLAHFNKVRKYVSNYPKRFSDPEAAARYRKRNRTPFFSKDFSKDYYGFGAYASKEGKRALGFGALGSILGIAGAIALTQGFAKGGEAKKLPSSGDFNDLLISHFGYNMRGQTYPVNRETKFHGRLVSPKGRHYFDLSFLRGNQLSQEFYRHQNEPNFNRDIYEGGIPSANQYKVSKKAYEDAVETMTKRLGLNPRAYTKHIIGYSNLGLNGSPTEGVFSSLSKNIYYNSSADYHTSYNTFLEEMIHALDNKGLDAGKFASQGDKGKRHPFYQLNNKIRNSYGMFEFSENMVGLERGFGSNFDFSDVMYVTIPAEITAKLIKSRLDKYNPALLPLTFGSKTTKIVDDTIEQIRKSPKSYFATGGGVPGTGNQDTIPALLTPGEFVFSKKTAQKIGYSNLERMNKIGRYATGGTVGSAGPIKMAEGGIFSGLGGNAASIAAFTILGSVATGAAEELDKFGKRVFDIDNAFSTVEKALITFGTQFYIISSLVKGVGNYRGQNPLIDNRDRTHEAFVDDKNRLFSPSITRGVKAAEVTNARINQLQDRIAALNRERRVEEDVLITPQGVGGYPGAKPYYQRQTVVKDKTSEQIGLERQYAIEYKRSIELKKRSLAFDKEAISKYKNTEIAITKNIQAVERLGYVMGALTAVSTLVGSSLEVASQRNISEGNERTAIRYAGAGRAVTNAGIAGTAGYGIGTAVGGAIGSFFGPGGIATGMVIGGRAGAAIGTLGGGVQGYLSGTSQAEEEVRNRRFNRQATRLNRNLASANQSPDFSFDVASASALSLIRTRQEQLNKSTDRDTVRASIGDELDGIRDFLTQSARKFGRDAKGDESSEKAVQEFRKSVKEAAEYYARFTNTSLTEVQNEFESLVSTTQKHTHAEEILVKAESEAADRIRRISLISSAISQVSDSLNRFDSVISGISDNINGNIGGSQYKASNILDNNENVTDFKKFEQILLQTASPFGETGRAAANDALNATQLINRLPTILANAANSGLLSEEGDIDTIIKKQLGENNPFAEDVLTRLKQELVSSGRDVTINKIRTDPQGFAKQLTHGNDNIIRPFQEAKSLINQELEKLSGGLALRRQIEFRYIDMLNSALDIRLQKEEALANAQDRPVNFASQSSVLAEQFKNIVGNATTSNNPADLGKLLTENTLRFNQLNASIAQGRPDIKDRANLELERDSVSETIERLKKGLEFIASGKQIGLIQRQLDIAKSQRETKQGFLTNFAFSDTAGRRAINKTLFNTQVVTNTGNVDAIRGDERGDVLGLAQTFKDIKLAIFGGITGQEFINNATANKFQSTGQFSPDEIDQIRKGQSSEEEKLISALEESYNRAISANEILASDMKSNQEQLIINLSNSFDTFLSELSDIFAKDNVKKAEEEVQKKEFNKSAIDEKIKTRNKVIGLNGQTLTDNEVAAARKNRGLNLQLVESGNQQAQIGRAHTAIERARKAGGPTQTIGELKRAITSDPDIRGVFGEDKIDEVLKEAFGSSSSIFGFNNPLKILNDDVDISANHVYDSLRRQISQQEEVVNAERDRISSQFAPGEIKTTNQRAFDRIYKTKRDENDNIINKGVDDVQEQESLKKLNELKRQQEQENSQASLSIPGLPGVGAFLAASSIGGVTPDKPKETLQETIARVEKRKKDHEARMAYMQTDVYKDKLRREEYDRRNPKTERVYPNDPNSLSGRYAAEEKRKADSIAYNKQLVAQAYANGSLRQSILPKKDSIKPNIKELLGKSGFYVDDATASAIGDNVGAKSNSSARQNNPAIKNQEQMVKGIDKISTTTDKAYSSSKPFYDKAKGSTSHLDQFGNNLGSFGADFDKSLNRMLTLTTNFSVAANGFVTSIGTLSKAVTAYQTSFDEFKKANNAFTGATAKFVVSAGNFDTSVVSFANSSEQLIKSLDKFPSSITVEGNVKAEVILNGLEVLTKLEPGIKTIVEEAVNKALKNQNRKEKL